MSLFCFSLLTCLRVSSIQSLPQVPSQSCPPVPGNCVVLWSWSKTCLNSSFFLEVCALWPHAGFSEFEGNSPWLKCFSHLLALCRPLCPCTFSRLLHIRDRNSWNDRLYCLCHFCKRWLISTLTILTIFLYISQFVSLVYVTFPAFPNVPFQNLNSSEGFWAGFLTSLSLRAFIGQRSILIRDPVLQSPVLFQPPLLEPPLNFL